ncbi:MAG: hypothetical protein Q4F96_05530 [Bacillota bacterium]|nr:hypothetical protein [Bacillota bacterium]
MRNDFLNDKFAGKSMIQKMEIFVNYKWEIIPYPGNGSLEDGEDAKEGGGAGKKREGGMEECGAGGGGGKCTEVIEQ